MPSARRQRHAHAAAAAPAAVIEAPPASRLTQRPGSPAAIMSATWRDPTDLTPDARRAPRVITGWRGFCPLRRMSAHPNSGITAGHIHAADRLREAIDLAALGYSGTRPLIHVATAAQPRWGLGPAAVAQMRAVRSIRRVAGLCSPGQRVMLDAVVLRNQTLRQWLIGCDPPSTFRREKARLLAVLDLLAEHFDAEVQNDLSLGKRLPP
jgi:hypothetical protein